MRWTADDAMCVRSDRFIYLLRQPRYWYKTEDKTWREFAEITQAKEVFLADVVTGTLYSPITGQAVGGHPLWLDTNSRRLKNPTKRKPPERKRLAALTITRKGAAK